MDSLAAIHEILSKRILLLSSAYFRAMRSPIEKLLESGGQISLPESERKIDRTSFLSYQYIKSLNDSLSSIRENEQAHIEPEQKIGLVFIDDVITKYGASCTLSTQSLISEIQRAEADSDVVAILFVLDSPGGSVWGLRQLAMTIRNTSKPTVGFISEMACSACFWLAQQMNFLVGDVDAICHISNVGVIGIHSEYSEYDKKLGVKRTIITDKDSTEKKVGNDVEPLSDEDHEKLKAEMDDTKEIFVSDILTGPRSHLIQDEAFMRTAVVVNSKKALKLGWIDAEDTFQYAIDKCFEIASATDTPQNSPSNEGNNSKISTMKFPLLTKIFQGGNDDVKVSFDNEAQAKQVEAAMTAYKSEAEDLQTQLATANTANQKLTEDLATANARITELEAMDAAEPTTSDDLEGFNPGTDNQAVKEIPFVDL